MKDGVYIFVDERCSYCENMITEIAITPEISNLVGKEIFIIFQEDNPEIFSEFNIFATPTVVLVKNGKKIKDAIGSNLDVVKEFLQEFEKE